MKKEELRERVEFFIHGKKIESATDIVSMSHPLYQKVYRQLFNNKKADITFDVMDVMLEKFPELSAEWLYRGEGLMERTKIVTPPTHRQDIHIAEGASAAISQTGSASIDNGEPIGSESFSALLNEKDEIIQKLQHNIDILKDAIRVLSEK